MLRKRKWIFWNAADGKAQALQMELWLNVAKDLKALMSLKSPLIPPKSSSSRPTEVLLKKEWPLAEASGSTSLA